MKRLYLALACLIVALFVAAAMVPRVAAVSLTSQHPSQSSPPYKLYFPIIQNDKPCATAGVSSMRRAPATIIRQMTRADTNEYIADITAIQYEAHQIEVNIKGRTGPRVTVPADLYSEFGTSDAPKIFVNNQVVIRKVEDQWIARHFLIQPAKAIGTSIGMAAGQPTLQPPTNFSAIQQGNVINFSWIPSQGADQTEIWSSPVNAPSSSAIRIFVGGGGAFPYPLSPAANSNIITINPGFETGDLTGYTASGSFVGVTSACAHSGNYSAFYQWQQGLGGPNPNTILYPVLPSTTYTFSLWHRTDHISGFSTDAGNVVSIGVTWYNSTSASISQVLVPGPTQAPTNTSWNITTGSATSPSNATYLSMTGVGGNAGGGGNILQTYLDDFSAIGAQVISASFYSVRAVNTATGQISPFVPWQQPVVQSRPVGIASAPHIQEDYTNALTKTSNYGATASGFQISPSGISGLLLSGSIGISGSAKITSLNADFLDGLDTDATGLLSAHVVTTNASGLTNIPFVLAASGTTGSPSFRFTGDDDTGIVQGGSANTLAFIAGGVERARITSGCFGLGTDAPIYRFDMAQGNSTCSMFHISPSGADTGLYLFSLTAGNNFFDYLSAGARYDSANWIAKAACAAVFEMSSAALNYYANDGLTTGNSFTPTKQLGMTVASGLALQIAGQGYRIKEGSNAKMGYGVISGGQLVVNTTAVAASSRVFAFKQPGASNSGHLRINAIVAGSSFTIVSQDAFDDSPVAWLILDPT